MTNMTMTTSVQLATAQAKGCGMVLTATSAKELAVIQSNTEMTIMSKEDLIQMLRGVGCDENTVTAMSNAYDLGFEYAKETMLALPVVELPMEVK
jgi:orotidine-5'-phosphate decarboxylase